MKLTSFYSSSIILSLFILFGCGGSNKSSTADDVEFSASTEKLSADIDKILADLPNPSEVPYTLQAAAADYNEDLINGLSKVASYQNDEDKAALNLGALSTDMGYLITYEQVQKSLSYLEACQKLSETLGVSSVFSNQMVTKFQESQGNRDTLSSMIDKAVDQAGKTLNDAERLNVGALILTGSFVEGLYLAIKVIETYPTDVLDEQNRNLILEPLVKIVLDQKKPLLDIISLLEDVSKDETVADMLNELNTLKLLYDGDLAEIEKKIMDNTGDFILTQDMLLDITIEVKRIRSKIVG
ncbi:MAG: hypothetical protein ACFHWX_08255 [Bacteroidota bacterium]